MTAPATRRIAIVGASGFVGATLVERALRRGEDNFVALIHSSGSAWRLTRWGVPVVMADLLNRADLAKALHGCTHVINCTRGGNEVMFKGLANLLAVCGEMQMHGFVHLSSVLVYGDPPAANSTVEGGDTSPAADSYGWVKLQQDVMVQKAATAGLPASILCPPNITGAYSGYLTALVDAIRGSRFALVDDGAAPANVVDVHNLCHAIELAVDRGSRDPHRLFITDDESITWLDLVTPLARLAEAQWPLPQVTADVLKSMGDAEAAAPSGSLGRSLKHLVSSDVREALRKDPLLAKADAWMRRAVGRLGTRVEDALRLSIEGPRRVTPAGDGHALAVSLCAQQLRGVRHSCDRARRELDYRPQYSFAASMAAFSAWYRAHTGMDSDAWPLLRQLFQT